jgi:hypothetical protein
MTPQEEQMLNDLVDRVLQTRLTEKDPEAEQLLNQKLGRNPDAIYILAQTVLVQKYALEQSQAQLRQLQEAPPPQPAHTTSFLGSLLGHRDPAPQPPPPPPPPPPQPGYGTAPYGQPWSPAPGYGPPPPSGGGSSFLRTAATTAAGVAAGALAFQGVESLLHGFGGQPAGLAGGGFFGDARPEETVINNYYDDPGGQRDRIDDSGLSGSGNDAMDLQQASEGLRDDGDDSNLDDSSYDDSSFDDSSNGDDLA